VTRADQLQQRRAPAKVRRVWALVRKETYQISRDPSSIAIGVVLPVVLILLFGYGLSLDVRHVPIAVVLEDASPPANWLQTFSSPRTSTCSSSPRCRVRKPCWPDR
jgi:hypothetical protein